MERETFLNRFTTQMAENKISNSRVGTDCCQHFWPAPGYVYTAARPSQYSWDCNILEQPHPPGRFQEGILAPGEKSWVRHCLNAAPQLLRKFWCSKVSNTWACKNKACTGLPLTPVLLGIQLTLIFHHSKCRGVSSDTQHGQKGHRGLMKALMEPQLPNTRQIYTQTASRATGEVCPATGQILAATGYIPEPSVTGG